MVHSLWAERDVVAADAVAVAAEGFSGGRGGGILERPGRNSLHRQWRGSTDTKGRLWSSHPVCGFFQKCLVRLLWRQDVGLDGLIHMAHPVFGVATLGSAMAKDILGEAGLHFDELNKLRILDPEVSQQTVELKEECKVFVDKIEEFKKIVGNLITLVDQLAKATENEKIKAIGARNLLKSIAKQREAQQQQLQALISEKKTQLERYRIEYQTLCKIEADQNEFIDQFIFQK
ncbi:hypothetical protein lerEdw1_001799 [Lerista edwardsae]|nr:hypothetical protein lerEdw1_001799 [Lerista edwardsae]